MELATQEQAIAPADGLWPWVGRITDDILSQNVPGSVVLLIIAICLTPYAVQLVRLWFKWRAK